MVSLVCSESLAAKKKKMPVLTMGLVMHRIFVEIYTSDVTVLRLIKKHAQSTQSTSDLSVRHPAPTKSSSLSDDPTNMHNFQVKYPKIHDLKRKMSFSKL